MSDDEHYERMNMDNDFEGGQFINGEFYYKSKKKKKQQSKEDRILGIFGGDSDSDGERRGNKRKREAADYTQPVSFVSSGIIQNQDKPTADATKPPEDEQEPRAGLGLGFSGPSNQEEEDNAEDDEESEVLPTAFGKRVKQAAEARKKVEQQEVIAEKKRHEQKKADPEFAAFEKHSKGIGMKLLQAMGYKAGEGLGKNKSGIAKPIEQQLRPKGKGLGSLSYDEKGPALFPVVDDSAKAAKPAEPPQPAQRAWKKKNAQTRERREYRTADQVLSEAGDKPGPTYAGVGAIIDMRGPQTRIITNLEHLNAEDDTPVGDKKPMPELQHNLQLLVDLCEAEIRQLDAKLRHEQDTAAILARERQRLQEEAARQTEQVSRVAAVVNELAKWRSHSGSASLSELERAYSSLKARSRDEYTLYNVATVVLAQVLPKLQAHMRGWQPLADPSHGLQEFVRWRPLLENENTRDAIFADADDPVGDPYLRAVYEVLLPPLRSAVLNQWEPRDPEPMLRFMEAWEKLLPAAALTHILEMLVLPKIRGAVEGWEPRQETVPVHAWLHPWLPYLGEQMSQLYPQLRYKLAQALTAWHPSDTSALILLSPWQQAFDAADWEALLSRSILPKLAYALQELVINPMAQSLEQFNWVMAWQDALPLGQIAALLEAGFFPKWHQALHFWLSNGPNFDEITRWYLGWKSLFPQSLLDHERVRAQFNYALNLMNAAVDGQPLPQYQPPPPAGGYGAAAPAAGYAGYHGQQQQPAAGAPPPGATWGAAPPAAELTLKDLVQRFAEEQGVVFMPKPGRTYEGLQVYAFGSVNVVLDNTSSVIRAQIRDRWAPVSLERLLQDHLTRGGR